MSLEARFPSDFEFYGLGRVERGEPDPALEAAGDRVAIAFRLHGDWEGVLVLAFDAGLDRSTYTEMSNIIASRFAEALEAGPSGVAVSPPHALGDARRTMGRLASLGAPARVRYHHLTGGKAVALDAYAYPFEAGREAMDV